MKLSKKNLEKAEVTWRHIQVFNDKSYSLLGAFTAIARSVPLREFALLSCGKSRSHQKPILKIKI